MSSSQGSWDVVAVLCALSRVMKESTCWAPALRACTLPEITDASSSTAALPHCPSPQTLIVWDYDPWSPNDEIGRCEIKLTELAPGQTKDLWLDVVSHSEWSRGQLGFR